MPHGSGFFFGRGIYCRSFMVTLDYRNARLALIGTWLAYVLFAALTDWTDFGLTATKDEYTRHFAVRVATVSFWLLIATVLLQLRRRFVNPGGAVAGAANRVVHRSRCGADRPIAQRVWTGFCVPSSGAISLLALT